jgi:hypothetical protein
MASAADPARSLISSFLNRNPGQLRTLLQLKLVGILTINLKNGVFWDVTPCGSCNIPEDTILHSYRRENLKSYND